MLEHDRVDEDLTLSKTIEELDRRFRPLGINVLNTEETT